MWFVIAIGIVVGVLICIAVTKDSKSDTTLKEIEEKVKKVEPTTRHKVGTIYEMLNIKAQELTKDKPIFMFKGSEFFLHILGGHEGDYTINGDDVQVYSVSCYPLVVRGLETIYSEDISLRGFIEDFIREAVPVENSRDILESLLFLVNSTNNPNYSCWVEIGACEYFARDDYTVYRFSDWKCFTGHEAVSLIKDKEIKLCENPKKVYWKHFLELEMKAKKEREVKCVEFIDRILEKQKEYNDLQYKYEMSPSAPISDYHSFINFCKIVSENVCFKEHEITNQLLLRKLNQ